MLILGQPPSACWKASVQEAVGIALVDLLTKIGPLIVIHRCLLLSCHRVVHELGSYTP